MSINVYKYKYISQRWSYDVSFPGYSLLINDMKIVSVICILKWGFDC